MSDSGFGFPHRNKPLGMYPAPAPFTVGSKFIDSTYPAEARFTVLERGSNFGEDWIRDLHQRIHDPRDCRVVEYLSPEAFEQRKQDRILGRLEAAYNL